MEHGLLQYCMLEMDRIEKKKEKSIQEASGQSLVNLVILSCTTWLPYDAESTTRIIVVKYKHLRTYCTVLYSSCLRFLDTDRLDLENGMESLGRIRHPSRLSSLVIFIIVAIIIPSYSNMNMSMPRILYTVLYSFPETILIQYCTVQYCNISGSLHLESSFRPPPTAARNKHGGPCWVGGS
jgi:hypothetical protein